jgi:hypothetical protein
VKGADLAVVAAKVEEADRRAAEADQAAEAVAVRREAVAGVEGGQEDRVAVAAVGNLAAVRKVAEAGVQAGVAVPAVPAAVARVAVDRVAAAARKAEAGVQAVVGVVDSAAVVDRAGAARVAADKAAAVEVGVAADKAVAGIVSTTR